jgi:hypothetical protein
MWKHVGPIVLKTANPNTSGHFVPWDLLTLTAVLYIPRMKP